MAYEVENPITIRPFELKPNTCVGVKVIAVVGATGHDWAAYMGLTWWTDADVIEQGDKIPQEAAEGLFQVFTRTDLKYRR